MQKIKYTEDNQKHQIDSNIFDSPLILYEVEVKPTKAVIAQHGFLQELQAYAKKTREQNSMHIAIDQSYMMK